MTLHDPVPPFETSTRARPPNVGAKAARDARVAEGLRLATTEFELAACRRKLRTSRAISVVLGALLVLSLVALALGG